MRTRREMLEVLNELALHREIAELPTETQLTVVEGEDQTTHAPRPDLRLVR